MCQPSYTHELKRRADCGLAGYPVAAISYFGPNDQAATKVFVAILLDESFRPSARLIWTTERRDLRNDEDVNEQILRVIEEREAMTVLIDDKILDCPHQAGEGRPVGFVCPECSFWVDKRGRRGKGRRRESA